VIVFYVPGFMGSELAFDLAGNNVYFLDLLALLGSPLSTLALKADGVSPLPPSGRSVYPGRAFSFEPVRTIVSSQLPLPSSWVSFSWDWRLTLDLVAGRLLDAITAVVPAGEGVTIVSHSAGGLVAVLAWQLALQEGNPGVIRRIVALGPPFGGSYLTQVALAGFAGSGPLVSLSLAAPALAAAYWTLIAPVARSLLMTWPAFPQLFPSLSGPEAASDPIRSAFYAETFYPDLNQLDVRRSLGVAVSVLRSVSAALALLAGRGVLTCVAGNGVSTPYAVRPGFASVSSGSLYYTFAGDGVVSRLSATVSGCASVVVAGLHTDLPVATAVSGLLASLLAAPSPPLPFVPQPSPAPEVNMALTPVTSLPILGILNSLDTTATKYVLLGFGNSDPTKPYLRGIYRSQKRAYKAAKASAASILCLYLFNGTSWFYVPPAKPRPFFV
jgi:hypothetical protein